MIKPKKLKKCDLIGIISPSWGAPSKFPAAYENGLKTLEELGFKIKEFSSARKDADFIYMNPEFRAKDINDAFKDKEVKAIIASIGGDDSVRILPYIDKDIIKNNPKIFLGFSDITTMTTYFNQLGLVTLNGPCILAGFSQWNSLEEKFKKHIRTILLDNPETYNYEPFEFYSDGYPDWGQEENLGKTKEPVKNEGWNWLQGTGKVIGKLFGGCIEVFDFLNGTKFWPKPEFWDNKILFLETSEEKPTPDQVKYWMRNLGMQGVLNKISAILVGRARNYGQEEKKELEENILKVVKTEFKSDIPIVTNMDFGHTDPQWIMPLGITAELDCEKKTFKLIEKIFED